LFELAIESLRKSTFVSMNTPFSLLPQFHLISKSSILWIMLMMRMRCFERNHGKENFQVLMSEDLNILIGLLNLRCFAMDEKADTPYLHQPYYDFNETLILISTSIFEKINWRLLSQLLN